MRRWRAWRPIFSGSLVPPQVAHLSLRVSWPSESALRGFPQYAFVSGADHNLLVLYVGNATVCFNALRGFYLMHNVLANSVVVVPHLPSMSVTMLSHRSIGNGVAVLRHGDGDEILLRRNHGRTSSKATLFIWWSSGTSAGHWMEKEVMLPFPYWYRSSEVSELSFSADTVLCWVDLLKAS